MIFIIIRTAYLYIIRALPSGPLLKLFIVRGRCRSDVLTRLVFQITATSFLFLAFKLFFRLFSSFKVQSDFFSSQKLRKFVGLEPIACGERSFLVSSPASEKLVWKISLPPKSGSLCACAKTKFSFSKSALSAGNDGLCAHYSKRVRLADRNQVKIPDKFEFQLSRVRTRDFLALQLTRANEESKSIDLCDCVGSLVNDVQTRTAAVFVYQRYC